MHTCCHICVARAGMTMTPTQIMPSTTARPSLVCGEMSPYPTCVAGTNAAGKRSGRQSAAADGAGAAARKGQWQRAGIPGCIAPGFRHEARKGQWHSAGIPGCIAPGFRHEALLLSPAFQAHQSGSTSLLLNHRP
eukprot:110717-Chlamydomonas_euryale.AAC.2